MRNETATAPTRDILLQEDNYTIVATRADIIETLGLLSATGCEKIALVTIHLSYYKREEKTRHLRTQQFERACQETAYLLRHIRPLVRKTDHVLLYEHAMYFVLPEANVQGAKIVEERLWEALLWHTHNMNERANDVKDDPINLHLRPRVMTIGHAVYPEPYSSLETLLNAADKPDHHFHTHTEGVAARVSRRSPHSQAVAQGTEKDELPLLARKLGIPYLSWLPSRLPQHVLRTLNARLARELHCYPVGRERNILTVAMLNPQDLSALERLQKETGLHIFPVLTHPEALESALEQLN